MIIQFCGLSGSGKSTLGKLVCNKLLKIGIQTELIDGDEYRSKLYKNLGFSRKEREQNIRNLGFIASRFAEHNIVPIICAVNPFKQCRQELKATYPKVKTVFIDCSIDTLMKRDTKGLYHRAMLPSGHPEKLNNLTGVNDLFEAPEKPDLYVNTTKTSAEDCADEIFSFIFKNVKNEDPQ